MAAHVNIPRVNTRTQAGLPEDLAMQPRNSRDLFRVISTLAPKLNYPPGMRLVQQNSRCSNVYLLERGWISGSYVDVDGRELVTELRGSGGLIGVTAAILGRAATSTIITITECHLRAIAANRFIDTIRQDKHLLFSLLGLQSDEHCATLKHLIAIGSLSARQRLEQWLWSVASSSEHHPNGPVTVRIPCKHCDLARFLAISPQHLCRLLNELELEHVLKRSEGVLVVRNPSLLWHDEHKDATGDSACG